MTRLIAFFFIALCALQPLVCSADARGEGNPGSPAVGIDERLGSTLPLDLAFTDETGRTASLRERLKRPTILVFVYFHCSHTCPVLLSGLSDVVSRISPSPGVEYDLLTVSIDPKETPADALRAKTNYIKAAGKNLPPHSWDFLTGSAENITRLADATGFRYAAAADGFSHPVALIVLSPQGKITRYLYGIRFVPMDLTLAITEASKGLAVPTVRKLLLACYAYDPTGKKYVLNILRITAAATLAFIVLFIAWLNRWSFRKRRQS